MLLLSDELIQRELKMEKVIDLVEEAFAADAHGRAITFPAIVEYVGKAHAHFGLKSGYLNLENDSPAARSTPAADGGREVLGLKAGGYWLKNQERYGLPNHRATLLLISPDTGEALAVMPANTITRMRTAAAGAVAARHLARQDATTVAVLGAGEQAHAQLEALQLTRRISKVRVWGRRPMAVERYIAAWQGHDIDIRAAASPEEALAPADIVVTTTPSTSPLVLNPWIRSGTHINAIGSDGAGKRELDPALIRRAKFVADKASQSETIGELQQLVQDPSADRPLLYAELGQICAGLRAGRENREEITIFDSSGVIFQDLVVADFLARFARENQLGQVIW
jgi:ornithine cyclodeaminase/alanine dehydrogenase-like protein (mu-crystallin family)